MQDGLDNFSIQTLSKLCWAMGISARNQLRGTVEEVLFGNVMAHITVRVGENLIESVITKRSAEELRLKKGDSVVAIIKSTEVMIQKD
jgi:molybdopterin-binding protein